MPKFSIPAARNEKEAEQVYSAIKSFAKRTTGWRITKRRIFRIVYTHDGKHYDAQVGMKEMATGEQLVAILDSNTYLLCTMNRGVARGEPILVGKSEVVRIEDFNADASDD